MIWEIELKHIFCVDNQLLYILGYFQVLQAHPSYVRWHFNPRYVSTFSSLA